MLAIAFFFITVNRHVFSNKQKQISFLSLMILQRKWACNIHANGLYSDYSVLRVVFSPLTTWLSSINFICFPSPDSAVVSLSVWSYSRSTGPFQALEGWANRLVRSSQQASEQSSTLCPGCLRIPAIKSPAVSFYFRKRHICSQWGPWPAFSYITRTLQASLTYKVAANYMGTWGILSYGK